MLLYKLLLFSIHFNLLLLHFILNVVNLISSISFSFILGTLQVLLLFLIQCLNLLREFSFHAVLFTLEFHFKLFNLIIEGLLGSIGFFLLLFCFPFF